jgi:hypothetical protein
MKHRPTLVVRRIVAVLDLPGIADEPRVKEALKTLQMSGTLGDPLMEPVEADDVREMQMMEMRDA